MPQQSFYVSHYQFTFDTEEVKSIVIFVTIKTVIRQFFSRLTFLSLDLRTRLMILFEHAFFTFWAWYVLVTVPNKLGITSWFMSSIDCWREPVYPFPLFKTFYHTKVATHVEDLLYMAITWIMDSSNTKDRDTKMDIHHVFTAALCLGSYITRYTKIGSLVMLLHDASDLPLDLLRVASSINWKFGQIFFFPITIIAWIYWRLWFLPHTVMYSIAIEAKSLLIPLPCQPGECTWIKYPIESLIERVPFLFLLGTLFILHCLWFKLLLKKGYRELFSSKEKKNNKSD